jgi:beta-lactamase class A
MTEREVTPMTRTALRIAATLLPLAPGGASAQAATQVAPLDDPALERLTRELERLAPISEGTVGVGVIHLETGREVYLNADEPFPMASTYKVPIAVRFLTLVDRGERSLSEMIEIERADLHPGSGTLSRLLDDPGVVLSVRNLMELMLLISDNSATDVMLRLAGGGEAVTGRMRALGIDGIRVDRPTSLLIGDYGGVEGTPQDGRISPEMWRELRSAVEPEERQAARERFAADPRDTSTPRGMATLLRMIWEGEALSPESTELLVDALVRVETGTGRIKGMLPPNTEVAHKTGTLGSSTNDVGIIYLPDGAGHVVTTVFVKDSEGDGADREAAIAQIARAIHDFFLFNPGM